MSRSKLLAEQLAEFSDLDTPALRNLWGEYLKTQPGARISRDVLIRAIAWEIQATRSGGLVKSVKRALLRHADEVGSSGFVSVVAALDHKPGTRLIREWQGKVHEVTILDDGYLWRGERHRSLSGIARAITGTRWSGPRFFGIEAGTKGKVNG